MSKLPFWANLNTLAAAIILGLLAYIGIQKIELLTCRLHSKDFQTQLEKMADRSEQQQRETARRVEESNERIVYVDRIAREIEKAPLPGQCKTPDAVMGADL